MARKTSSRRGNNTKTRRRDNDKKRGGKNMSEDVNDKDKDCKSHEPDCQCYLRKGIFLPPDLMDDVDEIGQKQDAQKS